MNEDIDCCRECGHFRFLHFIEVRTSKQRYFATQRCDPQNDHGCNCMEFIPSDNLSYIEYLAEKRGLI